MALTMLALALVYGFALAYVTVFAVYWARQGDVVLAILVFVPVVAVLAALGPYSTALRLVGATTVTPAEEPALHGALDRLCALAETRKPRIAIAETDVPEAFTVGVRQTGSAIVLTRGLLSRLEPPEVEAVLAHELAHVFNRDGAVMTVASFPVFAGSWLIRKMTETRALLMLLLVVWPYALAAGALYLVCDMLTRSLAMSRELAADRGAGLLTGSPEALASALQKLTDALPLIPDDDLRRVAPLNALLVVGVDPLGRAHPPVEERIAELAELGRDAGRPETAAHRLGAAVSVVVFVAVFAGLFVLFMRI